MFSWLFLLTAVILIFLAFWLLNKRLSSLSESLKPDQSLVEWLKSQQAEVQRSNQNINQVLHQTNVAINQRLDNAAKFISEVAREVGQMSEIGRSMRELQEFLKSPKLRGNIGEEVLKDLIGQMFPKKSFHLQYQFKSGDRVDAALKTEAGILPIDSKFPMENFRKLINAKEKNDQEIHRKAFVADVKKHIKDISRKYIIPDEGTMDFALMYVPSESVFYEIVDNPQLIDYARHQRVYIVSPNTLYTHLQMILLSFEGKRIELQSRKIFQIHRTIQKDYSKTEEDLDVLGKHLNNASIKIGDVFRSFTSLGQRIEAANQLPRPETPQVEPTTRNE